MWEVTPATMTTRGAKLDQLEVPVAHVLRRFFSGRRTMLNFSNETSSHRREGERGGLPIADGSSSDSTAPPGHLLMPPIATHLATVPELPV